MMRFVSVLILFLAISSIVSISSATSSEAFQEIFSLTCDGGVHYANSHDLLKTSIRFPFAGIFATLRGLIRDRAKCYCPALTDNQFEAVFGPIGHLFNKIAPPDQQVHLEDICPVDFLGDMAEYWTDFANLGTQLSGFPSACNLKGWLDGTPCLFEIPFPVLGDAVFQVAFSRCGGASYFPYVSVTCKGSACTHLAMPCNDSEECGSGLKCEAIQREVETCTYNPDLNMDECSSQKELVTFEPADLYQAIVNMNLYDEGDQAPGCYPADAFFQSMFSYVRKMYHETTTPYKLLDGVTGVYNARLCGPKDVDSLQTIKTVTKTNDTIVLGGSVSCTASTNDITNVTSVSCNIPSWDGTLYDGTSKVTDSKRMAGSNSVFAWEPVKPVTSEANVHVLLAHTCSHQLDFLPTTVFGTSVRFPWLRNALQNFMAHVFAMQQCRAEERSGSLSWEAFKIRFNNIAGALYHFVSPVPDPITGVMLPAMSDWIEGMNVTKRVEMPATCTYDHWLATGTCSLQFSGLQSLLGTGVTLRMYVRDCGGWSLPEFKVECVGEGCGPFLNPKLCAADSECPTGMVCYDLYNQFQKIVNPPPVDCELSEWSSWSMCTCNCGGGILYRERYILTDPANGGKECESLYEDQPCPDTPCDLDPMFCSDYYPPSTPISASSSALSIGASLGMPLGLMPTDFILRGKLDAFNQCSDDTANRKEFRKIYSWLGKKAYDNGSGTSVCMIDYEARFKDFNMTEWAEAQVLVEGDRIKLKTFSAWTLPTSLTSKSNALPVTINLDISAADGADLADLSKRIKEILVAYLGSKADLDVIVKEKKSGKRAPGGRDLTVSITTRGDASSDDAYAITSGLSTDQGKLGRDIAAEAGGSAGLNPQSVVVTEQIVTQALVDPGTPQGPAPGPNPDVSSHVALSGVAILAAAVLALL